MALPFPDGPAQPGLGQGLHHSPSEGKAAETAPASTVKLSQSSHLSHNKGQRDPDKGGREGDLLPGWSREGGSALTHLWHCRQTAASAERAQQTLLLLCDSPGARRAALVPAWARWCTLGICCAVSCVEQEDPRWR